MTEIKSGARYRVTFEGYGFVEGVRVGNRTHLYPQTLENALKVELIEPAYEEGAYYISSPCTGGHFIYRRVGNSWVYIGAYGHNATLHMPGKVLDNDYPSRPLRKLVPEA